MPKHMGTTQRRSRERGMAIIFYATMLFFVIGCVGLAVDVGTIYMIKARLNGCGGASGGAFGKSNVDAFTGADQRDRDGESVLQCEFPRWIL
jgi:uncharacterized protein involved in tellurium resistance